MGCIGGGIWPGDRCIFQINFSGVIQVLLSSSQALNSANYYQLGILKKQPEKHFTLLQLALAHQPVLCRVKYSCQAVMCFVFFPLPDYSWAEAELITSETVFLGWLQTKNVISQRSAEVSETRFHCNVEWSWEVLNTVKGQRMPSTAPAPHCIPHLSPGLQSTNLPYGKHGFSLLLSYSLLKHSCPEIHWTVRHSK